MNLFKIQKQKSTLFHLSSGIQSPLGDLFLNCEIQNSSIWNLKPFNIEEIDRETTLFSWEFENSIIELLKFEFIPKLPSDLVVDESYCVVWRIKSVKDIREPIFFSCKLLSNLEGSPESGEALECQSFENDDFKLSIGTEDQERFIQRAASQNLLPTRFQNDLLDSEYLSDGIKIILPNLLKGEIAQFHFIVSWSSKRNPEVSTWYAVDQSATKLIEEREMI